MQHSTTRGHTRELQSPAVSPRPSQTDPGEPVQAVNPPFRGANVLTGGPRFRLFTRTRCRRSVLSRVGMPPQRRPGLGHSFNTFREERYRTNNRVLSTDSTPLERETPQRAAPDSNTPSGRLHRESDAFFAAGPPPR